MEILKLGQKNFPKIVRKVVKDIKQGKVIVLPTDTVYGLVCDATNEKAVERLFEIKKRAVKKPIPIFVRDIRTAKKLALINKNQEKFLEKVWPGKVTVILKRKRGRKIYGIDEKTIGLRIPNYKLINILLEKMNCPLTGTSANISGKPASTKIKEVLKQFKDKVDQPDIILDAGNLSKNRPSMIVSLIGKKLKILRK